MKIIAGLTLVLLLAGCSQAQTNTQPDVTPSKPAPVSSAPAPEPSQVVTQSAAPSATAQTAQTTPAVPSTEAFCNYLKDTAEAQQSIEDPQAFVQLVAGAQAVAPGAISDDLALYVTSTKKLALTITGSAEQSQKADAWLTRNEAAVDQAEANLNAYAESTCGRPFITGE